MENRGAAACAGLILGVWFAAIVI